MNIETIVLSTKELQDALAIFCSEEYDEPPKRVIIQSYEKQIVVDLAPGGMITVDEFHHAASGA
jgi:hypothetical protein